MGVASSFCWTPTEYRALSLKIIHYPHPTLKRKSKPIKRVDAELKSIIKNMFELMYEANGIGLAANQVDLPLRFFVCNVAGHPDEGEEMVFINPVVSRPKGQEEREEGCLSLPGVYAPVIRPETIQVEAFSLSGEPIQGELSGMMARVVQHELDHLDGVMFIDRLSPTVEMDVRPQLDEFFVAYESEVSTGGIPSASEIEERWADLEGRYA